MTFVKLTLQSSEYDFSGSLTPKELSIHFRELLAKSTFYKNLLFKHVHDTWNTIKTINSKYKILIDSIALQNTGWGLIKGPFPNCNIPINTKITNADISPIFTFVESAYIDILSVKAMNINITIRTNIKNMECGLYKNSNVGSMRSL